MKKYGIYIICFVILLPLLFFNVKNSHDWGDDFAQYIHQSVNIVKGIPQSETGYVYNPEYPILGPPAYPIGFPLLLAPVYYFFGNSIVAFTTYISGFLVVLGILMLVYFRKYFRPFDTLLLVLIIVFNPFTLNFKLEIMSEIPFTVFIILAFLAYYTTRFNGLKSAVIIGLLAGFAFSIRGMGLSFILAIASFSLFSITKSGYYRRTLKYAIASVAIAIVFYLILNKLIFKVPAGGMFGYANIFSIGSLTETISGNLRYYEEVFQQFFLVDAGRLQFLAILAAAFALVLMVIGILNRNGKDIRLEDHFVAWYMMVLLVYPYSKSGFRFLFPVFPFLVLYIADGFKAINFRQGINRRFIAETALVIILLLYMKPIEEIYKHRNDLIQGPQEPESTEAFSYIRTHAADQSLIAFRRPRALALYTGKRSFSNLADQPLQDAEKKFREMKPEYYLVNTDISDQTLRQYVEKHKNELVLEWKNPKYLLYRRVDAS